VLFFAVRAGYLELDRAWITSLAKFAVAGVLLAAALWATARFASVYFTQMHSFRDETALLLLIAAGAFAYGVLILLLFGRGWLFTLVRDRTPKS
jgi:putative peptidoglycan lipid II flippase